MNKKEALYDAVIQQLAYYKEGNEKKYKDIFFRGLEFSGIQFDKKETADFGSYIYLDFLETIGVLEIMGASNQRKWTYLRPSFYHTFNGKKYEISPKKESPIKDSLNFFFSSLDIFPPAYEVTKEEEWNTSNFSTTLSGLAINYKSHREENLVKLGPFLDRYKFIEIYDPVFNKWQQVQETNLDGLYRAGPKIFEKSFFIKNENIFYFVKDDEWAYVFAQDVTSQGLVNRRFISESAITIPWKFKLPSLLKRILMASSERVSFNKSGIEYAFYKQNAVDNYLKTLGFIKEIA